MRINELVEKHVDRLFDNAFDELLLVNSHVLSKHQLDMAEIKLKQKIRSELFLLLEGLSTVKISEG